MIVTASGYRVCVKTHVVCHSEEPKGDEESRKGRAFKARFLAEFILSPFVALRAVHQWWANGLGMTQRRIVIPQTL